MTKLSPKIYITGIVLVALLKLFAPMSLKADTIDMYLSSGNWPVNLARDTGTAATKMDMHQLQKQQTTQLLYDFTFKDLFDLLPNVKMEHTTLDNHTAVIPYTGNSMNELQLPFALSVEKQLDLSHTHYTFYYTLASDDFSLDIGTSMMNLEGTVRKQTRQQANDIVIDEYIPLMYAKAKFNTSVENLSLAFEGNTNSTHNNSISDYKVYFNWNNQENLGFEMGYKNFSAQWENFNGSRGDISSEAVYAKMTFYF